MRKMGLVAIYPKVNTSKPNKQHQVYPYLLRDVEITHSNQVWSTDITYIFVERLWRSVKYENVYLKGYETMLEAYRGLKEYFEEYNTERLHQSLGRRRPSMVYEESLMRQAA